jgi:oligopeptide transport system ATP-binding protein
MAPLLEVRNLETQFKTQDGVVKAVNNVSFYVNRSETLGIVGESGSGKSVTSLSVMRLIPNPPGRITGGEVVFDGQDILKISEEKMRELRGNRIAMIFQDPMTSLNPVLNIGQQITESLILHLKLSAREARDRAIELLNMVGIPGAAKRIDEYPHQFSGGMRQRVMIAMALACNPELLIADEPTTALDVTIQAQILELIKRLQAELGMAVIIITHDLGVVAGMADRVMVMYAGRVVEEGTTHEIFNKPRMPYTIGLLKSIPRLDDAHDRRLEPIRGMPPDLITLGEVCSFSARCDYFKAGTCDTQVPPLRAVGENHKAACFFDITTETPTNAVAS